MKRRERLLAVVAGVVVALAVADRLVMGPLVGLWKGQSQRLALSQAELLDARELLKRKDSLLARYHGLTARVEGEVGARESQFLAFLHAAAQRAGIEIASEKPTRSWYVWSSASASDQSPGSGPQTGWLRYAETTVSLTFTCSLEALVRFLVECGAGQSDLQTDGPVGGAGGEAVRVRYLRIASLDPAGKSLEVSLRLSTVLLPALEGPNVGFGGAASARSVSRSSEMSL